MVKTREDYVQELVNWHFEVEPKLEEIYWVNMEDDDTAPIQLVEVSESNNSSFFAPGNIGAFYFEKTKDFPYPSLVAEVTHPELHLVAKQLLNLPPDFRSPFRDNTKVKSFKRPTEGEK